MRNTSRIILLILSVVMTVDMAMAQEVVRKTRLVRGSDYYEDVFYSGNQELARQKTTGRKVLEQNGKIPDGNVKFIDESEHTYGEEYYEDGKRQGLARTYYEDAKPKMESYYKEGNLLKSKEFYKNGNLRFEVSYEDARDHNKEDSEVGIGKLYFSDGTLRYEWNLTKSLKTGFKKAYNQDGKLVYEVYYDADGKSMPKDKGQVTQENGPQKK